MAEAKNSFIKSKMNKDLDERLIPNNEYRDALNVAISRSEGSDVGALEAVLGNLKKITENNNKEEIIGVYVDQSNNLAYYFTTDFSGSQVLAPLSSLCTISRYSAASGTVTVLVTGSFLNFKTTSRMNGISLIEDLLFFSDNRNQPRKINVSNDTGNYYTNEDQISVAKFAPYQAAEFLNLRSTATLKPSTMSDASDPVQTEIGTGTYSAVNLDTSTYRNGEEILNASDNAAWTAANTAGVGAWSYYDNSLANGVTYGKLYNRHAVKDSRGLAPKGFSIMSVADWEDIKTASVPAERLKSINYWSANPGTNTTGFNARPGGYRTAIVQTDQFANLLNNNYFWTTEGTVGDADGTSYAMTSTNQDLTANATAPNGDGYSVRLKRETGYNGWNGDPDYLSDKFVKFSYRFKFDDNEYSVVAPFSQDVFIPEQEGQFLNENETQAFVTTVVEFMQNSVNNAVLNIPLPSLDIFKDYKIKGIDIVFKESDTQAYQVLESIRVDQDFINALNYTNIYQYDYQSTAPIKTLPSKEATRVFDKVPVRAIAQETSGNRVMYANFVSGKSGQRGLDYYADVQQKNNIVFTEYPQHSLKQNRNYQVGIILADKFGRQTDIILSNYDNLLDSNGDPQPGSNVFSDYTSVGFNSQVPGWQGDTLAVNFNSLIPEIPSANNISGYPGAYAVGDYYTIEKVSNGATPPVFSAPVNQFFISYSTQEISQAAAANTVFTYSGLLYTDLTNADNSYNVFKNTSSGWILVPVADYVLTNGGGRPVLTFGAAPVLGSVIKLEVLFTSNKYYKYSTGSNASANPLTAGLNTKYSVGKYLPGEYTDYTEIKVKTFTSNPPFVTILTTQEVNSKYLFDQRSFGRPEPNLPVTDFPRSYTTYTINPDGFYSYRIGIKQQQQDYYNVYLPGIINGYPIRGEVKEQGETAFTTLISDNINKIPRNLNEVGPLQNQFTSDVSLFGRVTNTVRLTSNSIEYRTTQFDPLTSADDVNLVGTISDVFPGAGVDFSVTGDINEFCIYDFNTKPYVAKISTQKAIGLVESLYTVPGSGAGAYPYPDDMGLAVYETSPFVSALELFYEATTTGLVSDLNYDVQNQSTGITGISVTTAEFEESFDSGTRITSDFFPLNGGQIDNTTTASLVSVFNYAFGTTNLNNVNYATLPSMANGGNQRFALNAVGNGSFYISTVGTFYAGSDTETGFDNTYSGNYLATIRFTQADGTTVDQTIDLQLINSRPIFSTAPAPQPTGVDPNEFIFELTGSKQSPGGYNGSAADPDGAGVPSAGNWSIFDTSGNRKWSVQSVTTVSPTGVTTTYDNNGTNDPTATVLELGSTQSVEPTTVGGTNKALRFSLKSVSGLGNTAGYEYVVVMELTDTSGAGLLTPLTFSYNVNAATFTGMAMSYYSTGIGTSVRLDGQTANQPPSAQWNTMLTNPQISSNQNGYYPRFIGQIQNWSSNAYYITAFIENNVNPQMNTNAGYQVTIGSCMQDPNQQAGVGIIDSPGQVASKFVGQRLGPGGNNTTFPLYSGIIAQSSPAQSVPSNNGRWVGPLGRLKGFNASNDLINAGVRPGQINENGGNLGDYNFIDCALVNLAWSISGAMPFNSSQQGSNTINSTTGSRTLPATFQSSQNYNPRVIFYYGIVLPVAGTDYTPHIIGTLASLINAPTTPFYPQTVNDNTTISVSPTAVGATAAQGPTQ